MLDHLRGGIASAEQGQHSKAALRANQAMTLFIVLTPFIAAAYAFVTLWSDLIGWKVFAIFLSFYFATGLGITVGFHRMVTHRSFDAHPAVNFLLLVFGTWAIEGAAISWAAVHNKHHATSDTKDDPHSPLRSFFHSHMGWLFTPFRADPHHYARNQQNDRITMFVSRTAFWWAVLGLLLPFFLAGWEGFLWGSLVRVFLVHHVTWSVNSVCHTFGNQPYESTRDRSTNNWIVGLLAMGEGWHNNHHAFPKSAFHGLNWKQIDLSGHVIRVLGALRLANNIYRVPRELVEARKTVLAKAA